MAILAPCSIDAHIRRLRLKLGPARGHVQTVVGLGYRFVKEPARGAETAAARVTRVQV